MKTILFTSALFLCQVIFSQNYNFDCNNLTKAKLMNKYQEYKQYGLKLVHNDVDAMEFAIDDASKNLLIQLCINAWGEVHQNGADYTYEKFKRRNADISYNLYLKDIQYFETLSLLKHHLILSLKK